MFTKEELYKLSEQKLVIIFLTSKTCAPCRQIKQQIANQPPRRDGVKYVEIDCTEPSLEVNALLADFVMFSTPTLILLHKGREVQRVLGNKGTQTWYKFYAKVLDLMYPIDNDKLQL